MSENTVTQPDYTTGQLHSVKGTVVEAIGNATGATSWEQSGKEEHASGEAEMVAAQAQGYIDGTKNRILGDYIVHRLPKIGVD